MDFLEKEDMLPKDLRDFFISNVPTFELEKSCTLYGVEHINIQKISGSIGLIFVNDLQLKNLPTLIEKGLGIPTKTSFGIAFEINKRIFNKFSNYFQDSTNLLNQWEALKSTPTISEDEAWKKILELEPWILEEEQEDAQEKKEQEEKIRQYQSRLEKSSIELALKNYPELNEQLITAEFITLPTFFEPVRPSIKNWLADYTAVLYDKTHDSIARNNYLFHQKNTQNLNSNDRNRLSYLLKTFDENGLVTIDKNTKKILFPEISPNTNGAKVQPFALGQTPSRLNLETRNASELSSNTTQSQFRSLAPEPQQQSPANKISFSSPQKLSYEKTVAPMQLNRTTNPQPYRITPNSGRQQVVDTKAVPPKPLPRNTVNLRNLE
jgi:hypothetical protein